LAKQLAQQVIIDNVGGAGGSIGIQKVLQAPADGHTLVLASPSDLILAPLAMQAVRHKPEDLRLAAVLVSAPLVLLARPDFPARNFDELLAMLKKPDGKGFSYGSPGYGTLYHVAGDLFAHRAGVNMLHVPYKGGAPMMTDVMGSVIDFVFLPLTGSVPALIREGKMKAYGVTAKRPHPMFPEMPALAAKTALEGFEFDVWAGLLVPKATPDAAINRLSQSLHATLANPNVRSAFEATGNQVGKAMTPSELGRFYAEEIERYRGIAKSANLRPQ
jgi:tripartite-type tricarboxylate transporter receptor subunit TctC